MVTKSRSKIYVFGNPAIEKDSLPLRMLPRLREMFSDVEFVEIDPSENLPEEEHLVIIDTIINTDRVRVLSNDEVGKIKFSPRYSLHDFDLGFNLKLMKKLGKVKKVTIIGVPALVGGRDKKKVLGGVDERKVLEELKETISNLPLKNEWRRKYRGHML